MHERVTRAKHGKLQHLITKMYFLLFSYFLLASDMARIAVAAIAV